MEMNLMDQALLLRKEGHLKESNEMLIQLAEHEPDNPMVNYQCAWSFDVMGKESEAVPYYTRAISLGLQDEALEGALLGLGSTYRTLGQYEKSKEILTKGIEQFPNNRAIQVFYALTLYNLNEHHHAMEILLRNLVETTVDTNILEYKKALEFYSDKLDKVWK
ncbi:tetratricopeptide repeat protein [Heyndrickxia oleronia]|uniref:tetratricopeptide repeat protein n=1 Tax=Heyndrickxia oleronia TaxID=38875 RepID=UPI00203BAA0F|nr:tetratricopeptide repeat protein [Heyndrickxia oleronia]MCM3241061.1 tetratricopeptide repeat protein [Heyndrickxia oleronia]